MLKNLKNLDGVKQLSGEQQKSIKGGLYICSPDHPTVCRTASMCAQNPDGSWYCRRP